MISGRIMALDLTVNKIKIRAVAVYMPHCGYTLDEFDETYDQLRCISGKTQTHHRRLIIGGDFNTQIDTGYRGNTMQQFENTYGLKLANQSDDPWDKQWTFRTHTQSDRAITWRGPQADAVENEFEMS